MIVSASHAPSSWLAIALSLLFCIACSAAEVVDPPIGDAGVEVADIDARHPPRLVILISIDTLRPDHLGFYGYERFTSPVLDSLAAEGTVFDDASATTPWTLPSHASILTGRFPLSHGVVTQKTKLPRGIPTLASIFNEAGFRTGGVVNVGWLKKEAYGLTRDFEQYQWVRTSLERRSASTFVTDAAIEWLENLGDDRMFLFMHYYDLHSDYKSEPAYEKLFVGDYDGEADGTTWQLRRANLEDDHVALCHENFSPELCSFGGAEDSRVIDSTVEKLRLDARDVQHLRDLYDAQIRQLDAEIGRFISALRALGLLDETLLVVTSDHGEEFMEHGRVEHFLTTYQESLRVPLLIRGPGVPVGRVSTPVSSVDLAPTLLHLAGIEPTHQFDGLDLSPLLARSVASREREEAFESRFLYGEAAGGHTYEPFGTEYFPIYRSVRRGPFKLVHGSKTDEYALYDLRSDPDERHDVSLVEPLVRADLEAEMTRRHAQGLPQPDAEDPVELAPEDADRLRALGYAL